MAITSGDIGEAMKASANALASANNTMSESVALIATANKTVQDSAKVGNALRTISMRIRGEITLRKYSNMLLERPLIAGNLRA